MSKGNRSEFPLELIISIALLVHGVLLINYDRYITLEMTGRWTFAWRGQTSPEFLPAKPNRPHESSTTAEIPEPSIALPADPPPLPDMPAPPPPPLPPAPPHELWETLFGEEGGTGDANANTPGDQPMQAPDADETQAYLGKQVYTRDINSSNPGLNSRAADSAKASAASTPRQASEAANAANGGSHHQSAPRLPPCW